MSSAEGNNIEGESPAKPLSVSNKQQNKSRVSFSDLTTIHYIGGDSNNSNKDERSMKLSCEDGEDEKIELPSRCDDELRGRKAASFKYNYENTEMFKLPQTSSHDDSKSSEANKLKKRMLLCDSFYSSDAASFTTDTDHHGNHHNNDMRRNLMMMQLHNRHHYDDTDESLNQFEAGSYLEYVGAAKRSRLRRKLSRNTLAPPPTRRHHRAYRNPDLYEDESERFDVVNLTLQIGILLILCYTLYKKV